MPGADREPATQEEREALDALQYAGELMLVQFLSLVRTTLLPTKKQKPR